MKNVKKKNLLKKMLIIAFLIYFIYTIVSQQKTLNSYASVKDSYNEDIEVAQDENNELHEMKDNINSDEYIEYREPEFSQARSQDLEPMYHDVGLFYFGNVDSFLENKTLVPSKTTFYTMNELQIQDIDTLDDWKMAELKYRVLNNV